MASEGRPSDGRWTSGQRFLRDARGTLWLEDTSGTSHQLKDANRRPVHDQVNRAELEYCIARNGQFSNWLLVDGPRRKQQRGAGGRSGIRSHYPSAGSSTAAGASPATARTPSAPQNLPATYAEDIHFEYKTALASPRDLVVDARHKCYARHLFTDGVRCGDDFPIVQIMDGQVWSLTWDDTLSFGMTYMVDWKPHKRYFLLEDCTGASPSGTRTPPSTADNGAQRYASGDTGYYSYQNTGNSGTSGNDYSGYGQQYGGNYGNYGGNSYRRRDMHPMAAKGSVLVGRKGSPSALPGAGSHVARQTDFQSSSTPNKSRSVNVNKRHFAGTGKPPTGHASSTHGSARGTINGTNSADRPAQSVAQKTRNLARPKAVSTRIVSGTIPTPGPKPATAASRAATTRPAPPAPATTAVNPPRLSPKKALPWSISMVVGALEAGQNKAGARPTQSAALASTRARSRTRFAPRRSTTVH